jgi:hypothetical protein
MCFPNSHPSPRCPLTLALNYSSWPGLNPAIHDESPRALTVHMDHRVSQRLGRASLFPRMARAPALREGRCRSVMTRKRTNNPLDSPTHIGLYSPSSPLAGGAVRIRWRAAPAVVRTGARYREASGSRPRPPAPLPPNAIGIRRKQAAPFPNTAARQRRICDAQIRLRERWRRPSLPSRDGTSRGNPDGEAGMEAGPARRKPRDARLGSAAPEYEKGRVRARRFAPPIPRTARLRVRTPFGGF